MKTISILLLTFLFLKGNAQENDTTSKIILNGYAEVYYSFDFANPNNHEKPSFIYNHKKHNELGLNLLLTSVKYTNKTSRVNFGFMAGNYAQYNLASEPNWAKIIYEANFGIKLSAHNNIWLDAGIMPSHIGFESAVGKDCWTLTRSIMAENTPYYETGIKLSYSNKKSNLLLSLLLLNGWQKIKSPDNFIKPAWGLQVNYKASTKLTFNYSNFLGTDKPDSLNATRLFHNFYAIYEPTAKLGFTVGFDLGRDKYDSKQYGNWYSIIAIMQYGFNKKIKMAYRAEYYRDIKQIMITTNTPNGFEVFGISANINYSFTNKTQFRLEGKLYQSKDKIFNFNSNFSNNNSSITGAFMIKI
jgi:hypothetical protein